jgi:hypothetical protein
MSTKLINSIMYVFAADRFVDAQRAAGNLTLPYTSLCIMGPKATGKTVAVKTAAGELASRLGKTLVEHGKPGDDEFAYVRMSFAGKDSPGEANGLQEIVDGETVILAHSNFPRSGQGILHIEEFNRVLPQLAPLLQELPDQHLMDIHRLPPGWTVIFTGNPSSDEASGDMYSVTEVFDASFFNRLSTVTTNITHEEAVKYAAAKGWNKFMVNYMAVKAPDDRPAIDLERALPGMIVENQRTRQTVSTLLEGAPFAAKLGLPALHEEGAEPELRYLVAGAMGRTSAVAFISSMKVGDRPLDAVDVLDAYTTGTVVVETDSDGNPTRTKTHRELVQGWSDPTNRTSQGILAHITVERVLERMKEHGADNRQLANLDLFLTDLRRDEVQFFIRTAQGQLPVLGDAYLDIVQKHSEDNMTTLANAMTRGRGNGNRPVRAS